MNFSNLDCLTLYCLRVKDGRQQKETASYFKFFFDEGENAN